MSSSSISSSTDFDDEEDDEDLGISRKEERRLIEKARNRGIRVVSAFEGYAFDYGMRVGTSFFSLIILKFVIYHTHPFFHWLNSRHFFFFEQVTN